MAGAAHVRRFIIRVIPSMGKQYDKKKKKVMEMSVFRAVNGILAIN